MNDLFSFFKGSGVITLGMAIKLLLVFGTEVIAARILQPESYGLISWSLFLLNLICMFTGLGLNTAIRRFLPMYRQQENYAAVKGLLYSAIGIGCAGGVIGALLLFGGADWLARYAIGDDRGKIILRILVFAVPFWNLQKILMAVFAGFERPLNKVLIEDVLMPAGFLIVVTCAWASGFGEKGITTGYVIVYTLSTAVSAYVLKKYSPYYGLPRISAQYNFGEILKFSWPLVFTEPLGKSTGLIDILIVGVLATSYDVGVFRAASDIAAIMSIILMCFGFMFLPAVSRYAANKNRAKWNDLNTRVARWCMLASFPIFSTMFFFPHEIITLVYGASYASAVPVLRILSLGYFFNVIVGLTGINLVALGQTKILLAAHLSAFVMNLSGNYLLIPHWGIEGAAVASLLSLWIYNVICLIVMKIKIHIFPFNQRYLFNLLCLIALHLLMAILIKTINCSSGIITVLLFFSLCSVLVLSLIKYGVLSDATDKKLVQVLLREKTDLIG
ncbi:MAG: flippase [Desulfobacteraceae bacterium]|nr:flippase [Desulfobacteraceae bacterium]